MFMQKIFNTKSLSLVWQKTARGLLRFYLASLFALTFAGLIFKIVFYAYNKVSIGELSSADVIYALLWGLRFDLAAAAMFSLIMCLFLWIYYRISSRKTDRTNEQTSKFANSLFFIALIAMMSMATGCCDVFCRCRPSCQLRNA